jgi:hypothetical protein
MQWWNYASLNLFPYFLRSPRGSGLPLIEARGRRSSAGFYGSLEGIEARAVAVQVQVALGYPPCDRRPADKAVSEPASGCARR